MDATLGNLLATTALDLTGFFAGLNRVREESSKIGTVQVKARIDTTAMREEIARTSTSWKDLQGIADTATRTITRNLGGAGNEATNLRNQLRQAGSEFRTMDTGADATKAKVAGIVAEARTLKSGFEAGTAEARVLTGVIEQGRAALGMSRASTSPVIAQLRAEQASARAAVQDVNNYRIAWQTKANDDATTAGIMKRLEAGLLAQKSAIDAEITSLRSLGVLEEQQQTRLNSLIAQRNTFNQGLRTTSSVQLQIAGEIQKGSLAASVAMGTESTALKNLTGNTKFLIDQEKVGTLVGAEFRVAIEAQTLALRTQILAVQAEATALRGLGVNTAQETIRLTELAAAERALTTSAAQATAALERQNAAARAGAAAPLRAGLGAAGASGKLNTAGMALSFISPQAGMIATAASMGPVVAGAAAIGLALGGVVKLTKDGQDEAKKLQQAYLVMSANGIQDIGKINAELNDMIANGSDAERMFSKSELATALASLARGGVKGSDALTVLKVSTQLAAAEHIKLSEATERLYGNLQHLDMTADQASGFGDKLARASHLSMASMDNLSKGLNVAGATAHTMGFSVEETLAMLVRLAQKGMDPATIGATGLRNAMQKVLTPSKDAAGIYAQLGVNMEDSTGHMRTGRDIMQDLQKVFSSTAPVYSKTTGEIITSNDLAAMSFKIFGTRSATAFLSTLGNLKDMTDEVRNSSGFLTTYSGTVVSGLEGSQKRLDAATKNLSLTFAKTFTPALTAVATAATNVLTEVNKVLAIFDGNKSPKELQLSLKITSADSGTEKILKLFMGGFAGLSAAKEWAMPNDKGPAAQGRAEEVQSRLVNLGVLQEKSGADKLKQLFTVLDKLPMYEAMLDKKIAQVGAVPLNVPGMTGFGGQGPLAAPPGAGSTGNWNVVGAAILGNTGNAEADTVAGWCARWVRLTLDKAEPHAAKQIEKFFAGDANDIKATATNSKKLRTDLKQLQPGDVVVYDDNHVGIYVGKQMIDGKMQDAVRGNNRWGAQNGRPVVSTEKMTSLGSIAGYVRLGDVTGSAAATVPQRDPNWKAPAADPKLNAEGRALYAAYVQTMGSGNADPAIIARMREFKKKHKDLWDSIVADAKQGAKDLKAAGVSAADYEKWMAPAQRMAQLQSSTRVGGKIQSDADNKIAAWVKASGGDNSVAKKVLDYEVAALASANKGTKDYIASTAELNKYRAAALVVAQHQLDAQTSGSDTAIAASKREVAEFTKDSKVKTSVLALVTESLKNQQAAEQQAAKVREAAQAGDVTLAQQELTRLTSERDVKINLAKDSASQRLQVEKDYAKSVYDAGVALADAQFKQAQAVANDPKKTDPGNRVQALEIAEHDHTQALQKALDERNARTSSAQAETLAEQQKYSAAAKQLDIDVMTSSASRLKQLNDAKLESVKDNLTKVSSLTKVFAKDEYDRQVAIAAATRDAAITAAQKAGGPNQQKTIDAANAAYETAETAARVARDKSIADAKKAALDQQKVFADASRQLDVETMTSSAARLKGQNAQTLDLIKDNLTQRAALTKKFADEEYDRQVKIAQAERDRAVKALNPKDPNYGQAVGKLDNDLQTATSAANIARDQANAQAQDAVTKSVQASRDEYKSLAQGIRDKVAAGTLDDKSMAEAVAKLDDLAKKTALAGTSNDKYLLTARQSAKATYQAGIDAQIASGIYNTMADSFDRASKAQNNVVLSIADAVDQVPSGDEAIAAYIKTLGELEQQGYAAAGSVKAVTDEINRQQDLRAQDDVDASLASGMYDGISDGARGADGQIKPFEKLTYTTAELLAQMPSTLKGLDDFEGGLEQLASNGSITAKQLDALKAAIQGVRDAAGPIAGLKGDQFEGRGLAINSTPDAKTDAAYGAVSDDEKEALQAGIAGATGAFLASALKGLVAKGGGKSAFAEMIRAELASRIDVNNLVADIKENPADYQDGGRGKSKRSEDPRPNEIDFSGILDGIKKNRLGKSDIEKLLADPLSGLTEDQINEVKAYLITSHQDLLDLEREQTAAHLEIEKRLGLKSQQQYITEKAAIDRQAINDEFTRATAGLETAEGRKTQIYIQALATRNQKLTALGENTNADTTLLGREQGRAREDAIAAGVSARLEDDRKNNLIGEQQYLDDRATIQRVAAARALQRVRNDQGDVLTATLVWQNEMDRIQREHDAGTLALSRSHARALEDIQAQSQQEQLDLLKQQGLDEVSYLNAKELLDIAAAKRALARAIQSGTDQVEAEAQYQAQITSIQNKANADRLSADPLYNGVKGVFDKARTDQNNFFKGATSSKEYGAAMLENAAALEVFAKNLEKLGTPEAKQAAEILRSFALGYKNLTPEVSKTTAALTKGLNTVIDWAGAAGEVTGALGNLTGAMGETEQEYDSLTGKKLSTPWKDLSANLNGVGKAFNTLVTIATDVMAVITNPADIKAWGKLFADVINSIADALAGFKKAAAAVAKNKADFADQNPLLNPADYQKTYTRSRGLFADVFGGGPEVVNEIDKIGLKVAQGLATGVFNGLDAGFKKYSETGNLAEFTKALTDSIINAAKQGLIDGFKNDPQRQATFSADIKAYTDAGKAGDKAGQATALDKLKADAKLTTEQAKELLATLDAIDKANGTGRYDPAVIAAAQNKIAQDRANNEQTLEGLKNRNDLAQLSREERAARTAATTDEQRAQVEIEFAQKRLVINEAYERRKLAVSLKTIQLQMESELAAADLTEEQKEVIREKYRLQSEGANQDFADFLVGAQNDIADKQAAALKTLADAAASAAKQAADAIKAQLDGFVNDWSQIGATAFIDGLNAANFDTFFNSFRANLTKSVLEGTVAGLFQSMAAEELRPFAERLRLALKTPGTADDISAIQDLRAGLVSITNGFQPAFEALQPLFADVQSELKANTAATKENTQALKEGEFGTTIASVAAPALPPGLSLRNLMPTL